MITVTENIRRAILLFQEKYCHLCGIHFDNDEDHEKDCPGQYLSNAIQEIKNDFTRTSGSVKCIKCGKEFRKHPLYPYIKSYDGEPFLIQLCNGELVKL